jgi:plastocyanin
LTLRRASWLIIGIILGAGVLAATAGRSSAGGWWPSAVDRWSSIRARFSGPAAAGSPVTVLILDGSFSPPTITVRPGTTVRWVSRSAIRHTTTSFDGLWDSPNLSGGESYAFTFAKPGEYRYLCRQHLLQGMIATIIVK